MVDIRFFACYQRLMISPLTKIILDQSARMNLERRYWPKVGKGAADACWLWLTKAKHPYGYGRMTAGRGVNLKAHQIGWALANGPIPAGKFVLHRCDNPSCSNPSHLFLGDQTDNMRDAKVKGRFSNPPIHRGEGHHNCKLSDQQVAAIRADARSALEVAADYGVTRKTIYCVRRGERS